MILKDLHVHTYFSDGHDSPEEMAERAYSMGLKTLGFSDHSYTWFDESYCMMEKDYPEYVERISKLKKLYEGKMEILCGIEVDIYSDVSKKVFDRKMFDYTIASCHYLDMGGKIVAIDDSKESLLKNCRDYFDNDMVKMAVKYYKVLSDFIVSFKPDIVGHYNYIAKDNVNSCLFNDRDERYVKAWKDAADIILPVCNLFEINTGGISRGYRPDPYPSKEMVEYLKNKGAEFILSSDTHSANNLCFKFDEFKDYA